MTGSLHNFTEGSSFVAVTGIRKKLMHTAENLIGSAASGSIELDLSILFSFLFLVLTV